MPPGSTLPLYADGLIERRGPVAERGPGAAAGYDRTPRTSQPRPAVPS
ncbi:MAG: serine/threonine-protein phosphatase [Actinomycetota bacterium]|nr:serine/threonine-protein phosphatase [Actinomycetota bacterium]